MATITQNAFLLTRQWRDTSQGITLELWFASALGPLQVLVDNQEAVFFVGKTDCAAVHQQLTTGTHDGKPTWRFGDKTFLNHLGQEVIPVYFSSHRQARDVWRQLEALQLSVWEADIKPTDRYLMERFITGGATLQGAAISKGKFSQWRNPQVKASPYQPNFKVVSLDIETSMDGKSLYSIGLYSAEVALVFMVGGNSWREPSLQVIACTDQRQCLEQFFQWTAQYDPDIFIGWNIVQFDLVVLHGLCEKLSLPFTLGRDNQAVYVRRDRDSARYYMDVPGRVILDGIELLKAAAYNFVSYSLENVAQQFLGEGKLLSSHNRGNDIRQLFLHDKPQLARYNLTDCRLTWEVFETAKLLDFALARSQLTGLNLDRMGGSVAAFEYAYLPLLHRKGYVAPSLGELESDLLSPGGYVLDSEPGIYQNVLVLDFKSLYPSIIRTFFIDPYSFWAAQHQQPEANQIVPGYNGASFFKTENILPGVIEKLWRARDAAKIENNQPLSHAIKILMNSFYGVLGSTGCRFYDPRVCSSITLRGHSILQQTKSWIEAAGYRVIYGDTDSVFVWVGDECAEQEARAVGDSLALNLNRQWQQHLRREYDIDSALELEFETHYLKFLMPTVRGSAAGSKKRYAGVIQAGGEEKMVFKGLENVRTDWTELAKNFQQDLYRRIFNNQPVEDFIRKVVGQVRAGELNQQLLYRKRLRRRLAEYQKNSPPHVKAARLLSKRNGGEQLHRGDWITYYITVRGPEPENHCNSPLDYQHYIDKQLAPVADSILQFIGMSFAELTAVQGQLFDDSSTVQAVNLRK